MARLINDETKKKAFEMKARQCTNQEIADALGGTSDSWRMFFKRNEHSANIDEIKNIANEMRDIKSMLYALMQKIDDIKIFLMETDDEPAEEKPKEKASSPINDAPQFDTQEDEITTTPPAQSISEDEADEIMRKFDEASRECATHETTAQTTQATQTATAQAITYTPIPKSEMTQEELEQCETNKDKKDVTALRKLVCMLGNDKLMASFPVKLKTYLIKNYQYFISCSNDNQKLRKWLNYVQYYDDREMGRLVDALRVYWDALNQGLLPNNQQLGSETASYIFYYAEEHGTNFNLTSAA